MGNTKKIKFEKYTVKLRGHSYDIIIPPDTEQLWIQNYGNKHWETCWYGNRKGMEALLYAAAVLGFNPAGKVIYFPIRGNAYPESYRRKNAFPGESITMTEDCDLVFTTHQVQLKRSEWIEIRRMFKYRKAETYIFSYDRERTNQYFKKICGKWEHSSDAGKEYKIEHMQNQTLFYVLSRRLFQKVYLSLDGFLQRNLEKEFLENEIITEFVEMGGVYFPYRNRLQMRYAAELGFGDTGLEKRKVLEAEKGQGHVWTDDAEMLYRTEQSGMKEKYVYQVTDKRTDDEGRISEDIVYMNGPDGRTGEVRNYDKNGNPVSRIVYCDEYSKPYRKVEKKETAEYLYKDGRLEKAVLRYEEKELNKWKLSGQGTGLLFAKVTERAYFYNEDGSLQCTEDRIAEDRREGKVSFQEYSRYEIHRKNIGDRGGIPLSEVTTVKEHYRKREKEGRDSLLYRCTDLDFCEYDRVRKRIRTEQFYRNGSRKHPKKKVTTFVYDLHGKRVVKEFTDNQMLFHDYRDIDAEHSICITYRVRKEDGEWLYDTD